MGIFLQWPGWPSRHIDRTAAAGLESHGRSARKTYTGYACEGSIHLSDKVPNLARRTGPAAPPIAHKIAYLPTTQHHSKQTKQCTDLDHAITIRRSSARASAQSHDLRRGWGLRREMRIASSERHTPPPITRCKDDERSRDARGRKTHNPMDKRFSPFPRARGTPGATPGPWKRAESLVHKVVSCSGLRFAASFIVFAHW